MKHTLTSKAAELMRKNGRHRRWRRAFSGMAAVVVFITTYMLILPAITMENQAICGMAEHTHTDACYEMQLVCTQEETPEGADVHVHGPECYEQQQVLTCTKQEGEGHTHTDACYGYVCGQEESAGHTHTDACYTEVTHRELTCTEPESAGHTHGDGCYDEEGNLVCTEAESTGHTHGDSCYTETVTRELTCGQEESSGHTHTDACIGLICGQEEYEGHTHTDACYTTEDVLVCTEPTGHTHGDGCYEKVLVCDVPEHTHTEECYPAAEPEEPQEPEFICTLPEHSHEDACYDADGNLICGMEEHTHTEECYAPVEIPEEETPTTAFPEEIPEGYVEYPFDNKNGLVVTAYAPEGAFGQDVQLFAEVLPEDSEEYAQAKENLDKAENAPEYTGMTAMDIRFVDAAAEDPAQAEEIEPDAEMGQVFVKIDAQALIPEDVDESTLAVQHHAKVSDGGIFGTGIFEHTDVVVETVADNTEETGDITAVPDETALPETLPALADEPEMAETATLEEPAAETEETQFVAMNVEAKFAVNSFSTFTITWGYWSQNSVTVKYVTLYDWSGTNIENKNNYQDCEATNASYPDNINLSYIPSNISLSDFSDDVSGYALVAASMYRPGSHWAGTPDRNEMINEIRKESDTTLQFYGRMNGGDPPDWQDFQSGDTLYLIYMEIPETITTEDTSTVTINLFDYNSEEINNNHTLKFQADTLAVGTYTEGYNYWTQSNGGVYQGIVQNTLNDDGMPVLNVGSSGEDLGYLFSPELNASSNDEIDAVATNLNHLFKMDDDGYYVYDSNQNFAKLNGSNFIVYEDPSPYEQAHQPLFLPFNDYGTYRQLADYHFGMTVETNFLMPRDGMVDENEMSFTFRGDDDVWVFIDGVLILDMGGNHDAYEGTINFADGTVQIFHNKNEYGQDIGSTVANKGGIGDNAYIGNLLHTAKSTDEQWIEANLEWTEGRWYLKDYTQHTLKFFYMERGGSGSNCRIQFNLLTVPANSLTIEKEVTSDDPTAQVLLSDKYEYQFQVVGSNNQLLVTEGMTYKVYKGNDLVGTKTVGADGIIRLKDGERAVLTVPDNYDSLSEEEKAKYEFLLDNSTTPYYVQELLDTDYVPQFGVTVEGAGGNLSTSEIPETDFTAQKTPPLTGSSGNSYVTFTNQIKTDQLSKLYIKKELGPGTSGETFQMYVTINGDPLPTGTRYTVVGDESETVYEVSTEGIVEVPAGKEILLLEVDGGYLLAGSTYTVTELNTESYNVSYSGTISYNEGGVSKSDEVVLFPVTSEDQTNGGVAGEIAKPASETHIVVTNNSFDFGVPLTVVKNLNGYSSGSYQFGFNAVQVRGDSAEAELVTEMTSGTPVVSGITISSADRGSTTLYIGYDSDKVNAGTYYYKISEISESQEGIEIYSGMTYDTNYYIITVDVSQQKEASVTNVTRYVKNGDGTYQKDSSYQYGTVQNLPFTNSLGGDLSITKLVKRNGQNDSSSTAEFTFQLKMPGEYLNKTYRAEYSGTIESTLTHHSADVAFNQSENGYAIAEVKLYAGETVLIKNLPANETVVVSEPNHDGYALSWTINDTVSAAPNASVTIGAVQQTVTCTNTTGAVLPSTGGMGTTPFLALGTLLTLGAGMLLVQRRRKEGSDAV